MPFNPHLKTTKGVILFLVGLFGPALIYWIPTHITTLTLVTRDDYAYYALAVSIVLSYTFWFLFKPEKMKASFAYCFIPGLVVTIFLFGGMHIANYGFQRILYPSALITEEGNTFSTRVEFLFHDKPIYVDKDQLAPGQVLSKKTPFYQYCVGRTRHGSFYCSTPRLTKEVIMINGTEDPYYVEKVLPNNWQPKFSDDYY